MAAALWAFLRYGRKGKECVIRAVNFGGDRDTVGAMAGALVGSLKGSVWIPARWHVHIENGVRGREEIVAWRGGWPGWTFEPAFPGKSRRFPGRYHTAGG